MHTYWLSSYKIWSRIKEIGFGVFSFTINYSKILKIIKFIVPFQTAKMKIKEISKAKLKIWHISFLHEPLRKEQNIWHVWNTSCLLCRNGINRNIFLLHLTFVQGLGIWQISFHRKLFLKVEINQKSYALLFQGKRKYITLKSL